MKRYIILLVVLQFLTYGAYANPCKEDETDRHSCYQSSQSDYCPAKDENGKDVHKKVHMGESGLTCCCSDRQCIVDGTC